MISNVVFSSVSNDIGAPYAAHASASALQVKHAGSTVIVVHKAKLSEYWWHIILTAYVIGKHNEMSGCISCFFQHHCSQNVPLSFRRLGGRAFDLNEV